MPSQTPAHKAFPCFLLKSARDEDSLKKQKKKKLFEAEFESRERQIAAERKKREFETEQLKVTENLGLGEIPQTAQLEMETEVHDNSDKRNQSSKNSIASFF